MVECLNRGLAASSARWFTSLTCGVQVCPAGPHAACDTSATEIAAVGAVVLHRDDRRRTISAGLGYRAEGTAWRMEQFTESGYLAACPHEFCGPDTLAAFYRRSVVQSLGGLSSWAGDALAGIDLCCPAAGRFSLCHGAPVFTHVDAAATYVEPAFRARPQHRTALLALGIEPGLVVFLAAHLALLAGQCVAGLWRPSMFAQLAGRAWGSCN